MKDNADHFAKRSRPSRVESKDIIQLWIRALLSLSVISMRHYTNVCPCMALSPAGPQHNALIIKTHTRKLSRTYAHYLT